MNMVLDDTVETFETLDTSEDSQYLSKVLESLKLLATFQKSITDEKMVCRDQVKTMIEECQISLDDNYPIRSFTERPSATNVSVATESIITRAGQLVLDLIKKAAEAIVKMLRWVRDAFKNMFRRSRFIHQRVVVTRTIAQANQDIKPMATAVELSVKGSDAVIKARAVLAEAIKRYQDYYNGLVSAILTESSFIGTVKAISLVMPQVIKLLESKMALTERAMAQINPNQLSMAQQLAQIAQPMPLGPLESVGRRHTPISEATTLLAYFEELRDLTNRMHETSPTSVMEWEIATKVAIDDSSGFDEPMVAIPDVVERACDELTARTVSIMNHKQVGDATFDLGSAYDKAMMTLVGDVHALTFYTESVNLILDSQVGIADCLYRCQVAQFELYRAIGSESSDRALIEEINRVQHKLREKILNR